MGRAARRAPVFVPGVSSSFSGMESALAVSGDEGPQLDSGIVDKLNGAVTSIGTHLIPSTRAYHIRSARKTALENENAAAWETFCPTSACFKKTDIQLTII